MEYDPSLMRKRRLKAAFAYASGSDRTDAAITR
jgi:hypothetical protein